MRQRLIALYIPHMRAGGAERVTANLAYGFVNKGYLVDLILGNAVGQLIDNLPTTVRIIDLKCKHVSTSLAGLYNYLRHNQPDALISCRSDANIIAILAKRLAWSQTILAITIHSTMSIIALDATYSRKSRIVPFIARLCYKKANRIITVSHGVANDASLLLHIPISQINTIYNPIIMPGFKDRIEAPVDHPWFTQGQPPVIITVGRLIPLKDHRTLLYSFQKLITKLDCRLMIIGDGPLADELTSEIRKLGMEDRVILLGYVPNPLAYIAKSAVFALTSKTEALPTVLIEALSCGIPVVSTDCPSGPREILEGGKYGKLVPVGDVDALYTALYDHITNPVIVDAAMCCRRFTLEYALERYEDCIFGNS